MGLYYRITVGKRILHSRWSFCSFLSALSSVESADAVAEGMDSTIFQVHKPLHVRSVPLQP